MHLQQTKRGSRGSGGPQYYFHDLTRSIKIFLRDAGVVRVALVTPYGATKSDFFAVSAEHKLDGQRIVSGSVGHDRIQQGRASESIGEAIRLWYRLPPGDFERVDIDVEDREDVLYITPLKVKYASRSRTRELRRVDHPLTFTKTYVSQFWTEQLVFVNKSQPGIVAWALEEICRVVADHRPGSQTPHIQEPDLLRASGPLRHLGMSLGAYVGKGYDCLTEFRFLDYPTYSIPVEVKKRSSGFKYQEGKYGKDELSRAIVLCAIHEHKTMPRNVDVIELDALCAYARTFPVPVRI